MGSTVITKKGKQGYWDNQEKRWKTRDTAEVGETEINQGNLAEAAKKAKEKPKSEETEDSEDMTVDDYKEKYGALVGTSKYKAAQSKKTKKSSFRINPASLGGMA